MKNLTCARLKDRGEGRRGGMDGCPDFENSEKPHTERWSQATPKISTL